MVVKPTLMGLAVVLQNGPNEPEVVVIVGNGEMIESPCTEMLSKRLLPLPPVFLPTRCNRKNSVAQLLAAGSVKATVILLKTIEAESSDSEIPLKRHVAPLSTL